jgi:hypothetical protein
MEVSPQLHAPAALPPGKELPRVNAGLGVWVVPAAAVEAVFVYIIKNFVSGLVTVVDSWRRSWIPCLTLDVWNEDGGSGRKLEKTA